MELVAAGAQSEVDHTEPAAILSREQSVLDLKLLDRLIRRGCLREKSRCHRELPRNAVVQHLLAEIRAAVDILRPRDAADTRSEEDEIFRLPASAGRRSGP